MRTLLLAICAWWLLMPASFAQSAGMDAQLDDLRRIILEQVQTNQMLQEELGRVSGSNELLTHQLTQMNESQQRIIQDLNQRIEQLERQKAAAPPPPPARPVTPIATPPAAPTSPVATSPAATPAAENSAAPAVTATPAPSLPPEPPAPPAVVVPDAQTLYDQAFKMLQTGQYGQAITYFNQFLSVYSEHSLASNAQYWLGESYYAQRDYQAALAAFNRILDSYPGSSKRSHALLKAGFIYYDLNDKVTAKQLLKQVVENYPDSALSRLAEERLKRLSMEGY